MSNRPSLDDYVDVAERIQDFKDAHPQGSLQTIDWEIKTIGDRIFVVYRAAAFRDPDDAKPGHGIAWEPFPGRTPYTKDSELMNAETAAWGRAIVALGLVANRSLASRQEVRNRRADQEAEANAPEPAQDAPRPAQSRTRSTPRPKASDAPTRPQDGSQTIDAAVLAQLRQAFVDSGHTQDELCWFLLSVGVQSLPESPTSEDVGNAMRSLTLEQAFKVDALLKGEDEGTAGNGEAS